MGYNFKKIATMAIISVAVVLSITGCNQNADEDSVFQTLDIEQLETDTTDINDRAEYYDKNVDDRIDEMTDEEKEKFYVNLTLTYTGREYYEEDYIIFLRNDNVYEGDLYDGDDTIGLSPGIYRVISSKAEGGRGAALGDIYLLTPGEDVTLNVDYTSSKATIIREVKLKSELATIYDVAIIVSDYEKSKDFYVNKLGFVVVRENFRKERNDWKLDLRVGEGADAIELEIFAEPNPPKRVNRPEACGLRHLAFRVDDVEATVAELEQMGIGCEPIRLDSYTQKKMTFFFDPDGLPLELHE